ncbi:MAG: hydantoinase/oxoprolinase family protein [Candidatus Rokuibacteriota bacterium]|nr:MAG: hydantoinase/oxoprolinase family protein [Candidatus Rokubacteria bacterium]
MSYRVGFDVGGTFTDFVLQSPGGELTTAKRLTTYPDPSAACLEGLDELIGRAGVPWAELGQAVHGTTLGSNVVIERKARGVGLLTTRGFRDVLIIGREKRYQVYDLQIEKPRPLIARRFIGEVTERVLADGSVRDPLDEADARRAIRELVARGVTTLAVCLLHAYLNPVHEKRLAALVAEEAPYVDVTLSHEVSPTFREYERTSTTVVNAYVMTAVRTYLRGLQAALGARGYRGRLFVMQSSGGVATAEAMERYPVRMIESGPAAGALMAAAYGELTGHRDLIAFDMGGTTAKLALIEDGRPFTTTSFELHRVNNAPGSGLPMNIQAIDLVEIGAGGGSIARAALGVIVVGPESASSTPGPVCYGRGGTEPTVTDANLVLGYLNPEYFAGGSLRLHLGGAARAIEAKVGTPLGLSLEQAAWGIHTIVNSNMELATRVVSIERGRDPRALTFVAFGGSGPVHGCRLAQALGIPRVILPAAAGVTAAIGLLAAEVRFDVARTYVRRLDALDPAALDAMYADMTAQATEVVRESAAAGAVTLARAVDVRYVGQGYELTVPVPSGRLDAGALARVRAAFDGIYAARYGYAQPGEPVEVVTWKLSASAGAPRVTLAKAPTTPAAGGVKGRRRAYFPETGGWVDCPVYDRYSLAAGLTLAGPAIVEERESTSVLPPGTVATVDEYASLVVEVPGR